MFVSVERCIIEGWEENDTYFLKDSDFECELLVPPNIITRPDIESGVMTAIEYQKRNLPVLKNLLLCNLYLLNRYRSDDTNFNFKNLVCWQEQLAQQYFKEDQLFNKKFWKDLKKMYDKYKVFL